MKKVILTIVLSSIALLLLTGCESRIECGGGKGKTKGQTTVAKTIPQKKTVENEPLNISIFLDLSDRVEKNANGMSQVEKDTAIINSVIDYMVSHIAAGKKISKSKDAIKVFFYPSPSVANVNELSKTLDVDFSKLDQAKKRPVLIELKSTFDSALEKIYSEAISQKQYPGCDIWGFFNNNKANSLCVKEGYRNIMIILSDGYVYHENNKVQDGNNFSYILPKTLSNSKAGLIPCPEVPDLEVLFLEINPYSPQDFQKIEKILTDWFSSMKVKKLAISETDIPNNTEKIIENFMRSK